MIGIFPTSRGLTKEKPINTPVYIYLYVYIYMCVCVCVYTHKHIYIYSELLRHKDGASCVSHFVVVFYFFIV